MRQRFNSLTFGILLVSVQLTRLVCSGHHDLLTATFDEGPPHNRIERKAQLDIFRRINDNIQLRPPITLNQRTDRQNFQFFRRPEAVLPYFSKNPMKEVRFYVYDNRSDPQAFKEVVFGDYDSIKQVKVPEGAQVKILIHGFTSSAKRSFPQDMKNAYLQSTNHPVICVDWSQMAGDQSSMLRSLAQPILYGGIVDINIPKVGKLIGNFIVELVKSNLISSLDQVHVIGHSLGAHVSGEAGKTVQEYLNGAKIGRITGLDPARPQFENKNLESRLDKSDANFVDVIHTSHLLGDQRPTGHVDFFPNSAARVQPGCEKRNGTGPLTHAIRTVIGNCDHRRAVDYFIKSIVYNGIFGCRFAEESGNYRKCSDQCDPGIVFGEYISYEVQGAYCFNIKLEEEQQQ